MGRASKGKKVVEEKKIGHDVLEKLQRKQKNSGRAKLEGSGVRSQRCRREKEEKIGTECVSRICRTIQQRYAGGEINRGWIER